MRELDEDGELHCENGPAFISRGGSKYYYIHGEKHREDGPAVEYYYGTKLWYIHGRLMNCSNQEEFERLMKLELFW